MGFMDYINSWADHLKGNAPDITPVKDACRGSYHHGSTVVNTVKASVVGGVSKNYPDSETQAKIGRIATIIGHRTVDYILQEVLKSIPGRDAFDKIVMPAIRDEMALQAEKKSNR